MRDLRDVSWCWPPDLCAITQPLDDVQRRVFSEVQASLAKHMERVRAGKGRAGGLVLIGKSGRGKSATAAHLALIGVVDYGMRCSFVSCTRAREDLRGLPSEQHRNFDDYRALLNPDTREGMGFGDVRGFNFCVLNDVGQERGRPEAEEMVRAALDWRTEWPVYTVITSNLNRGDLIRHLGGDREESRLSLFEWLDLSALPDYRKART